MSVRRRCRSCGSPRRGRADLWSAYPSAGTHADAFVPRFAAPLAAALPQPKQMQEQRPNQSRSTSRSRGRGASASKALREPEEFSARLARKARSGFAWPTQGRWPSPPPVRSHSETSRPGRGACSAGDATWWRDAASRLLLPLLTGRRPILGAMDGPNVAKRRPPRSGREWGLGPSFGLQLFGYYSLISAIPEPTRRIRKHDP